MRIRRLSRMPKKKAEVKPGSSTSSEFDRFNSLAKRLISVPKKEIVEERAKEPKATKDGRPSKG